ncbi:putative ABC transport system permease protein [Enterococcus sp. PF1-24]|uniref:FtsX-like permease family protein n=1 Tax=unclassified Enterococcus TaxID=2608891 RepID=UPI002476EF8C|nr:MULTISPECIES: FtsX-like permease family protein [unclassified Enterococcus]MDH6363307.1 putative ABC transport system permease protein [Enterococcus sp. PFB1-1]MDH6400392.1 putative ABC transport system permease protein [Enterococcus sp. PF1-24]
MKSLNQAYSKLRRKNLNQYFLLTICIFLSVLLISAFSVTIESHTVQRMLPAGGDSRKQMMMIFLLAILGCGLFTTYASALFFRGKSREFGIYMALGVRKKRVVRLLCQDLLLVAVLSTTAGILLGTLLAAGLWQVFQIFIVNTDDMYFSIALTGYLWPLLFSLFTIVVLLLSGWLFIRRSNVLEIINQQRKTEQVKEVKRWYGIAGLLLLLVGVGVPSALPQILAEKGFTPPFWVNLFYLVAAVGLYFILLFLVVRGFGSKQSYYKNIITRSMMRFQGRQTVLNMCVITLLTVAGYFALFYIPMNLIPEIVEISERPIDFAFHYQATETAIPQQEAIEALAAENKIEMQDYLTVDFVNLATDGYDREWTDDGRYGDTYYEFYNEESFMSVNTFQAITKMDVSLADGEFIFVTSENYVQNPYDYFEEMTCFTNPDTKEKLTVKFAKIIKYNQLHRFILLSDNDYAQLTNGLSDTWREKWIQFNVADYEKSYDFAKQLNNIIIDNSSQQSAIYSYYDRVEKMNVTAKGESYFGDTVPEMQVDYDARETSEFTEAWRYMPYFRILDKQNMVVNRSVYIMLFFFMMIICLATVIIIAYTRSLTIAVNNRQVYTDLHRLGANQQYIDKSVKNQVAKVFFIPIAIGTLLMFLYSFSLMYNNDGQLVYDELLAITVNGILLLLVSGFLYFVYRLTLKKVRRALNFR